MFNAVALTASMERRTKRAGVERYILFGQWKFLELVRMSMRAVFVDEIDSVADHCWDFVSLIDEVLDQDLVFR